MLADLQDVGINIDIIMLCETFLNDINKAMFHIPGYQFSCKNRIRGRGGGVAMFIRDLLNFVVIADLSINHDIEFESLFVEVNNTAKRLLVGEIYRVPGTSEHLSIQRYKSILHTLADQNFNFLNIE